MGKQQTGIYAIDYYAYQSPLRQWNSTWKVLFGFGILFFCVVVRNVWVSLFLVVAMGTMTIGLGKLGFFTYLKLLWIPLFFLLFSSIAISFEIHMVQGIPHISTSKVFLYRSLTILLHSFGAISTMYMILLSTPASQVIGVFGRLPIPKLCLELMQMIYRFIFLLLESYRQMHIAAESRVGFCNRKRGWYSFCQILGNLLVLSLRKANKYYDALLARGYQGTLVFLQIERPATKKQKLFWIGYSLLLLLLWYGTKGGTI